MIGSIPFRGLAPAFHDPHKELVHMPRGSMSHRVPAGSELRAFTLATLNDVNAWMATRGSPGEADEISDRLTDILRGFGFADHEIFEAWNEVCRHRPRGDEARSRLYGLGMTLAKITGIEPERLEHRFALKDMPEGSMSDIIHPGSMLDWRVTQLLSEAAQPELDDVKIRDLSRALRSTLIHNFGFRPFEVSTAWRHEARGMARPEAECRLLGLAAALSRITGRYAFCV